MPMKWLRRFVRPIVKGSPAGEVMLECLRRDVTLDLQADGTIRIYGDVPDVNALSPFVEQHKDVIFAALLSFKVAVPPPTLAELH